MTEWEYKEDTWRQGGRRPELIQYKKSRDNPDQKMYASLDQKYTSRGFHLGEDGYPKYVSLELDGLKEESFSLGGTILPNKQLAVPLEEAERQIAEWISKLIPNFPSWLGHHSKEGWEIIKIFRRFYPESNDLETWCVFRREI